MRTKITTLLTALAVTAFLPACKDKCKENIATYSYAATLKDTDVSSPYFQDNVAAFNVGVVEKINVNDFCEDSESTANLTIHNLTSDTISFGYVLTWQGYPEWTSTSNVVIPPNDSVYKGEVNKSATGYGMGGFLTVTSGPITYE